MARIIAFLFAATLLPFSLAIPTGGENLLRVGNNALDWGNSITSNPRTATKWSFTDCGDEGDALQLKSLTVSPDPPEPGKELTITAEGTVKETIEEGAYADVVVKLGLIKLLHKQYDVCDELAKSNATFSCPVKPDEYTLTQTVNLPKEIPRAKFNVQGYGYTVDDAPLACFNIVIDFIIGH